MQIFARNRDAQPDEPTDANARPPVRRTRLLVVDENPTALSVMGRRLAHMGYDVVVAENGVVGVNKLQAQSFDLILIDMGMKLLSGIATMRRMRASGLLGRAAIMMITGRSDSVAVVEALHAGADDHIVKPFDFEILDARVRHIVARARQIEELSRYNAELDARIARRAVELGEARSQLDDMKADRSRLVASIQALHEELERVTASRA